VTNGKIADFKPLLNNPNRHTARGLAALQKSIQRDGYTEPMVAAADGTILSGNARLESVAEILNADPIIVESDGTRPVIHRRVDIADAETDRARHIIVGSNRISELDLAWSVEVLASFDADMLDGLWAADELSDLGQQWADEVKPKQAPEDFNEYDEDIETQYCCPKCGYKWSGKTE
jgi:hypothetical protein